MAPTLLETLLPLPDVVARRSLNIDAPSERVYQAAGALPLMQTRLARRLLALRALPARWDLSGSPEDDSVFIRLAEEAGREVVFGFAGRFWHPSRNISRLSDAGSWERYVERGAARAAVNIQVDSLGAGRSRLSTETRVLCFGAGARRIFKLYWLLAGPFSGWIRADWLRCVAREALKAPVVSGSPVESTSADETRRGARCPR